MVYKGWYAIKPNKPTWNGVYTMEKHDGEGKKNHGGNFSKIKLKKLKNE